MDRKCRTGATPELNTIAPTDHFESGVIAGLDPAIHPFFRKKMDARVEPAHDGGGAVQFERHRF
jgi:hypothetical protein